MNALLIPVGSAGDVHPFVGLGLALRRRGHAVTIITNPHFEPLVRRVGLDFVGLGEPHEEILEDPDLWHPRKGFFIIARAILPLIRELYHTLTRLYVPGQTVVAAASLAFGARVAQDHLGIPTATVHLQPSVLRSVHESPVLPGVPMPAWSPRFWKRFVYWLADRFVIDPPLVPEINAFRKELGLPPVSRVFNGWWNSPQRVLGLFPAWFAPPQPDWPPQIVLSGFPLYDESGVHETKEVDAFLAEGDVPLVFTPGSAMRHAHEFFAASAEACRRLGRRGLLLTRYAEQVPQPLPEGVRHFEYVPFSGVLPRAAALVHHGGIGTTAQALAAGVPQLIVPLAYDQFDNAARVRRLGVGVSVARKRYTSHTATGLLERLTTTPAVADACKKIAEHFQGVRPLDEACLVLERLAGA